LDKESLQAWREEIASELNENILGFWMRHTLDHEYGGFVAEISSGMVRNPDASKGLVLNARILWTFSCAYRLSGNDAYLAVAGRAYDALRSGFRDPVHGGLYWAIAREGDAVEPKKQVYGQAFAIYGLAEYVRATGSSEALEWAKELYVLLEKHAYDPVHAGYYEALARDWSPVAQMSLSGKDLNVPKSMNTHLHMLEAYTNLYRVWQPEGLRNRLAELIVIHLDKIVVPGTGHFKLFFSEEWQSVTDHISYGHDIEGSWLLLEAAEALGDEKLLGRVWDEALTMAKATLEEGTDADGGIRNETEDDGSPSDTKDWWPQAEAVVGYLNAYQMVGDDRYLTAARKCWTFIERFIRDPEHGEWHWGVDRDGKPLDGEPKVGAWKCPYHNGRACFEAMERLDKMIKANGGLQ
jgi:mannobiose 2-epimerase